MSITEMIAEWRKGCHCDNTDRCCPLCTNALIVAIEERLANMFPPCVCFNVESNPHKSVYESVADYLKPKGYGMQLEPDDFASPEDMQQAIDSNELWTLQLYPITPVGFWNCAAPTFDKLVALAWKIHNTPDHE